MSRVPYHETEAEAVNYHTALYYDRLKEEPGLRANEDKHIEFIEHINARYLKALAYEEPGLEQSRPPLDFEGHKNSFIENIDFLTQVFTKKKEKEQKSADKQKFLDQFKNR